MKKSIDEFLLNRKIFGELFIDLEILKVCMNIKLHLYKLG